MIVLSPAYKDIRTKQPIPLMAIRNVMQECYHEFGGTIIHVWNKSINQVSCKAMERQRVNEVIM